MYQIGQNYHQGLICFSKKHYQNNMKTISYPIPFKAHKILVVIAFCNLVTRNEMPKSDIFYFLNFIFNISILK
jgi:hypothetical protein